MKSSFVNINGVPTKVGTYGPWIEDDTSGIEELIIFIPGNPGFCPFYKDFLERLHEKVGWPVWIIGHAGHEIPDNEKLPPLKTNKHLYNLEGQIKHKIEFMKKYVPKNARVYLVGHSVGTYIISQLLKYPEFSSQVIHNYLLFPTLEDIADTPNGKFYRKLIQPIIFLALALTSFLYILPYYIQYVCILIYALIARVKTANINTICEFMNPKSLRNVFFMADDEMIMLKSRENEAIKENLDKITVYFGSTDGWGPPEYFEKLKKDFPDIKGEISKTNISHAFCLNSSHEMADQLGGWLLSNDSNK